MLPKLGDYFRLRFGIIGFETDCLAIILNSEFVVAFVPIGVTTIVIRLGKLRVEFYHPAEVFDGTHQGTFLVIGSAAVDIGIHKMVSPFDGSGVFFNRPRHIALSVVNFAEPVVCLCQINLACYGGVIFLNRSRHIALSTVKFAEIVIGVRIPRVKFPYGLEVLTR